MPNILNIQYISERKGKNKEIRPAKMPPTLKAIITVQICVIIAVIEKTRYNNEKISLILLSF